MFGPQQVVVASDASSARAVFAADIDGDGDMDLASASAGDSKIAWYNNTDGAGTFGPQQVVSASADGAYSVFAADIDGDGDMDLASASFNDDKIAWYENVDGAGTFGPEQVVSTSANGAVSVFAADIDGDGDMDLASASQNDDKIAWYENVDGAGTFGPEQVVSTSADSARSVFAADIDGDGDMDLASASLNDDKIAWYENVDGAGTFGPEQVVSTSADGAQSVFAADFDGDGDMDLASASLNDDKIAWYNNTDGVGTFGPEHVVSTSADFARSVFAADIDGDGDMDLASASEADDKIAWYENTDGAGTFGPQQVVVASDASSARAVFAADIDGDGDMDLASASYSDDKIAWYENTDGAGTFGPQQVVSTAADGATSVFAADIDGDGDMDLASASEADKIAWYENVDGAGTFGPEQVVSTAADGAWSVFAADIDGDGDMDLASASFNDDKIAWYENVDGVGTFGPEQVVSTSANAAYSVFAADIDGDGDMDLASASSFDDKIAWYENVDGAGTFGPEQVVNTSADGAWSVFAADIDGDGDMDLASASFNDDKIAWYENTDGAGTFGPEQVVSTSADSAQSVFAADIDGDGDMDLASASFNDDKIAWYENVDGAGTFGPQQVVSTSAKSARSVFAADIDGDGEVDLASASRNDDKIAWYRNIPLPPPPPPPPFVTCPPLTPSQGSSLTCSSPAPPFEVGITCTLVCNAGLTPLSPSLTSTTCVGPGWSSSLTTCSVVSPSLALVTNGTFPVSSLPVDTHFEQLFYALNASSGILSQLSDTFVLTVSSPTLTSVELLRPGIFNVTGRVPTTVGVHALGFSFAQSTPAVGSFSYMTTAGPLAEVQVTGPVADGETELEFGVPLVITVRLTDAFSNVRNPDLSPSLGGGDVVAIFSRRGTTAVSVPSQVLPSGEVQGTFSTDQGGIYSLRVVVNGEEAGGSPFLVVAATRCGPGTRIVDDLCEPCPENTFSDAVNSPLCSACPPFTESPSSSPLASNCTCVAGTWLTDGACEACPVRATCAGGLSSPLPRPGFIQGPDSNFVVCPRPSACTGSATCARGYTGDLCATCAPGFYSDVDGACVKCPPRAASSFAGTVVALVALALVLAFGLAVMLAKSVSNTDKVSSTSRAEHMRAFRTVVSPASLSMILVAFQVVGILAEAKLGWNSDSQAALSIFTFFNIDFTYLASECALETWHLKYALSLILPALGLLLVLVGVVAFKLLGTRFALLEALEGVPVLVTIDTVVFTASPLVYLPLSRTTFTLFDCTLLANGKWVLDADPGVICFDSKWWSLFPLGGASLLVFVLGVPAYFALRLFLARNTLFEPATTMRLGSLYRLYRRAYYWGEVAALMKRLAIVVAGVFFSRHQLVQIGVIMSTLIVWMISVVRTQPFYIAMYNGIDLRLNMALLLVLLLGVGSYAERPSDSSDGFFVVAIYGAIVLLVLVAIHAVYLDIRHLLRTRDSIFYTATQRQGRLVSLITTELQDVEADADLLRSAAMFVATLDDTINERRTSRRPNSVALGSLGLDEIELADL